MKSEDFWEDTKGVKPAKKTATPKPKSSAASAPAKAEIEKNDAEMPLAKVGATVEVELEKGQGPVGIKITKEMAADREAALAYATDAARGKALAEIQLCVAAALYLGEGQHAPWVIDGFQSPREAAQIMLGWSDMKVSYRKRLGQAFIKQYGKGNVLQRAQEIGVSQVPYHKLREFLKAPKQLEQFLNTGRFLTADNKEITVDDVCKQGVGQLNLLFDEFARASGQRAIVNQPGQGAATPEPLKILPLSEKESIISSTYLLLAMSLEDATRRFAESIQGWPQDAVAVINSSPYVLELQGKVKKWAYAAHLVATMATYDPEGMSVRLDFLHGGDLGNIEKVFREVVDEHERFQKERSKK